MPVFESLRLIEDGLHLWRWMAKDSDCRHRSLLCKTNSCRIHVDYIISTFHHLLLCKGPYKFAKYQLRTRASVASSRYSTNCVNVEYWHNCSHFNENFNTERARWACRFGRTHFWDPNQSVYVITYGARFLSADWLRQRTFFLYLVIKRAWLLDPDWLKFA